MYKLIGPQLILLLASICLGACTHISLSLVVPEPISYTAPNTLGTEFDFDRYLDYTQELATQWDSQAKLDSISRLTQCNALDITEGQSLLARYWRHTQYWFGQRIEWFEVSTRPENPDILIDVWTSVSSMRDKPPVVLDSNAIDYTEALQKSLERGGVDFMTAHPSCYLAAGLDAGRWLFVYSQDRWRVKGDPLKICVDSQTGEPCEFPDLDLPEP